MSSISSASLDSVSSSSSSSSRASFDYDEEYRLAQKEWEESLDQLQTIVSVVLLPLLGKWLGRKWSHWAYQRYMSLGLQQFLFGGGRPTL